MQSLYQIGFWNYTACGVRDERDVALWKELGFNLAMSFVYDPNNCEKADMLRTLDACEKEGLRVILYDKRTDYHTLLEKGEAAFLTGVKKLPVVREKALTVSEEGAKISGGVILRNSACDRDLSLSSLLAADKEAHQAELAGMLFPGKK